MGRYATQVLYSVIEGFAGTGAVSNREPGRRVRRVMVMSAEVSSGPGGNFFITTTRILHFICLHVETMRRGVVDLAPSEMPGQLMCNTRLALPHSFGHACKTY